MSFEIVSPISGRWIQVHAYPSRRGLGVSFQDITELKQAMLERERSLALERQAREEAERLGRLKDEFLATLSHELRTPLNAILGWAAVLRRAGVADVDFDRGLESIERNSRLQATIISDLLDMSRIISGRIKLNLQSVQLHEVVRAAVDAIEPTARAKNLGMQISAGSQLLPVRGDPERLQQVFWNILSNAVKYTPEGGRIRIRLERPDSHLQVWIQDTGVGIPADFLPHVFDRFRQADSSTTRRTGGLGLGLSIVKSLVELHGGSVSASSEGKDRGSTFLVRLPVAADSVETTGTHRSLDQALRREAGLEAPTLHGRRLLVVEDDADSRALILRVLQERGARVRAAEGATEALHLLDVEQFDVLISDIGMPGMDGYELMRAVRRRPADRGGQAPAIALTAFAQDSDRGKALTAGFQQHLPKPVDPLELVAAVARALREGSAPHTNTGVRDPSED